MPPGFTRTPRSGDDLPALAPRSLRIREAAPNPAPGPVRARLAAEAAERIEAFETRMVDAATAFTDAFAATVLGRLRGVKARRGTRYWVQGGKQEKSAAPPVIEYKALDGGYVVPDRLVADVEEAMRPVALTVTLDSARDVAERLYPDQPDRELLDDEHSIFAVDRELLDDLVGDAIADLLGTASDAAEEVRDAIIEGDRSELEWDDLLTTVERTLDRTARWVQLNARTTATALANRAALEQAQLLGVTFGQWISRRDGRVRPTHVIADGQVRALGEPFKVGRFELDHPGDPSGLPATAGEVHNCVVAGTVVEAEGLEASFRAPYSGDIVTIRTASGRVLTGTPNHPVLTERGWVGLGELHEGDHVIGARGGQRVRPGGDPDVEGAPARIEQVHDALAAASPVRRMDGAAFDFYGDRPDGEVDVVATHRPLRLRGQAALGQHVEQGDLDGRDVREALLTGRGDGGAGGLAVRLGADRGVRRGEQGRAFGGAELAHAGAQSLSASTGGDSGLDEVAAHDLAIDSEARGERLLRLACEVAAHQRIGIEHADVLATASRRGEAAQGLTGVDEPGADGGARYPELLADACRTLAGPVALDRVVDVVRRPFVGHVFTLQAESGLYLTEGIISKNCRCGLLFAKPDPRVAAALMATARSQLGDDGAELVDLFDAAEAAVTAGHFAALPGATGPVGHPAEIELPHDVVGWRVLTAALDVAPGQQIELAAGTELGLEAPRESAAALSVVIPAGTRVGFVDGALVLLEDAAASVLAAAGFGVQTALL